MSIIEFRGKTSSGEWHYGYLCFVDAKNDTATISVGTGLYIVDIDTVSQWTGMKDCNGTKIYDGDVIGCEYQDFNGIPHRHIGNIGWCYEYGCWTVKGFIQEKLLGDFLINNRSVKVIGNIYNNPRLLDGE